MKVVEWATTVKPDLVRLQQETGVPALWAAAQMAHESAVDGGDALSELATKHHNYAGLKWAEWEKGFGCAAATMGTWEEISGNAVSLEDSFCSCPSWEVWLQVYAQLLDFDRYRPAKAFGHDPLLYGFHIWQGGWATDSRYIVEVAGWMTRLYELYSDTLPAAPAPAPQPVAIVGPDGRELCQGWLDATRTVVPLRPLWEGLGHKLQWEPEGPKVILSI